MKYSQAVVLGCIGAATLASARPASSRLRDSDAIPAPRQGSVGEHFGLNQRSYDDDLLFLRDFFEEYSELALRAPTKVASSGPKAKVPATHSTTSSTTHGQTGTKHTTGSTTNHALTKDHSSTDKKLTGTNTNSRTATGAKHPSTHEKTLPHQEHATNGRTTTGANHPSTATNGRTTTGANHPSTADKSQVHKEHTTNGRTTPGSKPSPAEGKGPTHQTNTALRKPGEKSTTTPGKPHTEHDLHGGKQSLTGDKLNHQREQHLKDANGRLQHQLQGSQQSLKKDQSTIHRLEREKNTWEHRAAVNAYRRPAPYYAPPPAYGYRPRPYGGYGGYGSGYYRRDFADEAELLARELADELDARDSNIEDLLEMRSFGDFEVDELD